MNLALVIVGVLLLIASGVVFAQQARALTGTIIGAVGLLMTVAGWVMLDGGATLSEALRTGGLASATVVALYALWLNDRRRKIDEDARTSSGAGTIWRTSGTPSSSPGSRWKASGKA